jgi:hypothetical protein
MTEREWTAVVLAFTDLFDIVKEAEAAPSKVDVDKIFIAGKILQKEIDLIQVRETLLGMSSGMQGGTPDWKKHNEELEKKKEAQRSQELGDLTQALKLSIEKAEKNRQGE